MPRGKSTSWAIRYVGTVGFGLPTDGKGWKNPLNWRRVLMPNPAVRAAAFQLKNLTTGEERLLSFSGACLAAGIGRASANIEQDWVHFETERPYGFGDFEGWARMGNFSVGVGVGVSLLSFVVFDGIDVKQAWYFGDEIPLNIFNAEIGADLSYCPAGVVTQITDTSDLVQVPQELEGLEPNEGMMPEAGEWTAGQQCIDSPFALPQSVMPCESQTTSEQQSTPTDSSAPVDTPISGAWPIGPAQDPEPDSGSGFDALQESLGGGHGMSAAIGEALPPEGGPVQETGQHAPEVSGPDQLVDPGYYDTPGLDGPPGGEHTGGS